MIPEPDELVLRMLYQLITRLKDILGARWLWAGRQREKTTHAVYKEERR